MQIKRRAGDDDAAVSSRGDQLSKTRKAKRGSVAGQGLSKEIVLQAALNLIDKHGLDGFSMRVLAQDLDVYPTAIYWYVANKNALLAEVVGLALNALMPSAPPRDWERFLTELFQRYRAAIRKHPNIAPLIGAQLVSNAGVDFGLVDRIVEALSEAGFSGDGLLSAFDVVIASMVGFVTMEFANLPAEDASRWADAMREKIDAIDESSFPHLHRYKRKFANRHFMLRWESGVTVPLDHSFNAYVEAALNGLKQLRRV